MITNEQIEEAIGLVNEYSAGMCLCGRGESCATCIRSDYTRKFERAAKILAATYPVRHLRTKGSVETQAK